MDARRPDRPDRERPTRSTGSAREENRNVARVPILAGTRTTWSPRPRAACCAPAGASGPFGKPAYLRQAAGTSVDLEENVAAARIELTDEQFEKLSALA